MVVVVGVADGKFYVRAGGPYDGSFPTCDLTKEALSALLKKVGFDPTNEGQRVMCSSSMDFPDECGAPKGFQARDVLQDALALTCKGSENA